MGFKALMAKAFVAAAAAGIMGGPEAEAAPAPAPAPDPVAAPGAKAACPVNIAPANMKRIAEIYTPAARDYNAAIDTHKLPNAKVDIDISAETAASKLKALDRPYGELAQKGMVPSDTQRLQDIRWANSVAGIAQSSTDFANKYDRPCPPADKFKP